MKHICGTHSIAVTHSTRKFITASAEQEMHISNLQFWWC